MIGVSRSGKTPTSLYLALQSGVYAANYPLTEDDLLNQGLPPALKKHKHKLFGLTIDPQRLVAVRHERKGDSRYASKAQCEDEIRYALQMFERYRIPYVDTTHQSIEEIATKVLVEMGLKKHKK